MGKVTSPVWCSKQNLIQFGVFAEHLSIDEQMVPFFGRHSCKMFIRGKPIRLATKTGYYAQMMVIHLKSTLTKERLKGMKGHWDPVQWKIFLM